MTAVSKLNRGSVKKRASKATEISEKASAITILAISDTRMMMIRKMKAVAPRLRPSQ